MPKSRETTSYYWRNLIEFHYFQERKKTSKQTVCYKESNLPKSLDHYLRDVLLSCVVLLFPKNMNF